MKSAVISRRRRKENLLRAKRAPRLSPPRRRKELSASQGHSPNGGHDKPPGEPMPAANGQSTFPVRPLMPTGPRLVPARAGDHPAIHQLLLSQFRGPSSVEFQAQLDEPLYEPTDRLLVKQRDDVVAHLRLTKRLLSFGPLKI